MIERAINIETLIGAIISQHYVGTTQQSFIFEVLYDEYFSFGLKRRRLKKFAALDQGAFDGLGRINTIRNYFAHCNQEFLDAETGEARVIDPRVPSRGVDFDKLYAEFLSLAADIEMALAAEFKRIGGVVLGPAVP